MDSDMESTVLDLYNNYKETKKNVNKVISMPVIQL